MTAVTAEHQAARDQLWADIDAAVDAAAKELEQERMALDVAGSTGPAFTLTSGNGATESS
jgi:hypothetical protein